MATIQTTNGYDKAANLAHWHTKLTSRYSLAMLMERASMIEMLVSAGLFDSIGLRAHFPRKEQTQILLPPKCQPPWALK